MAGVTGTGSTPAPAHQYVEVVRHTRVVVCSRVVWCSLVCSLECIAGARVTPLGVVLYV